MDELLEAPLRSSRSYSGSRYVPFGGGAPPPYFSQVFILKLVKVLYFDTLSQVFILIGLRPTLYIL